MPDEYIRRDAAMKAVASQYGACRSPAQNRLLDEIRNKIRRMPAADVAPAVQCKDCEHYDLGVCLKIYSDGNLHPEAWQSRKPTDFCSYGTPKNDGGET